MNPPPTISIITPSFNHAPFIGAAINSVLEQNYPHLEYLIVDGGSTDQTLDILKQYGSRLRWISEPDRGQTDAINKGFSKTTGEILGWLNSDDTYAPGTLAAISEIFQLNPNVGIVYGNADFIDARGNFIAPCAHIEPFNRHRLLHYSDFLVQPAAFFRRAVFEKVGGLDPELHWAMDYDFWLKASAITQFQYLPRTLANYRWLPDSKTGIGGAGRLREVALVARRHGARRLPAYFRLEAIRMRAASAITAIKRGRIDLFFTHSIAAMFNLIFSPRAILGICSARTWKIIRTGQLLRRAAAPQTK